MVGYDAWHWPDIDIDELATAIARSSMGPQVTVPKPKDADDKGDAVPAKGEGKQ